MIYRYIYKIICTASSFKDKFYYGQHTTDNLNDGYKGSGVMIQRYYKKHPNDYVKEIISFHNTQEELNQAEYDIIHPWLGNELCLNLIEGGHLLEETRKKISDSNKGKIITEEHRKHLSEAHKGKKRKPLSEETRKKLSETLKGRISPTKGKKFGHLSEEHKKKISDGQKGRIPWNKGKKGIYSEETLKKISETLKGRILPTKGKKRKPLSEEHKKHISESLKNKKTL